MFKLTYPLAITMWDFSWLERRWPGAGYESWDEALDALLLRGYDAVRIDAYPHLLTADPYRTWELLPQWDQQMWGAAARCRVQIYPALIQFIEKCAARGLKVALSSWFRQDVDDTRMRITTPLALANAWQTALDLIDEAGLLGAIGYVDLCNEFPLREWAPFLYRTPDQPRLALPDPLVRQWMNEALTPLRQRFSDLPFTFSFTTDYERWREIDVTALDFLELHLWMTMFSDFYQQVGYGFELFSSVGYDNLQLNGEALYQKHPAHWQAALCRGIDLAAGWSQAARKPLITTECWGIVDYKDWPLLSWGWIKELCELGVRRASASGRWAAIATSNFCGPQFVGMWREVAWHQHLTELIHNGRLPEC
jgi:hypothetical protein